MQYSKEHPVVTGPEDRISKKIESWEVEKIRKRSFARQDAKAPRTAGYGGAPRREWQDVGWEGKKIGS